MIDHYTNHQKPTEKQYADFFKIIYEKDNGMIKKDKYKYLMCKDKEWHCIFYTAIAFKKAKGNTIIEKLIELLQNKQYKDNNKHLSYFWLLLNPKSLDFLILQFLIKHKNSYTTNILVEFFFELYHVYDSSDLDDVIKEINCFIPIQLKPFFDLVCYYSHCKDIGMDILTSWITIKNYAIESKNEFEFHQLLLQRCRNTKNRNFLDQIRFDLLNWFQNYQFPMNHFWNWFGYTHIQQTYANERAINDYKKALLFGASMHNKKLNIFKQVENIITNVNNFQDNAYQSAIIAQQCYCKILKYHAQQASENADKFEKEAQQSKVKTITIYLQLIVLKAKQSASKAFKYSQYAKKAELVASNHLKTIAKIKTQKDNEMKKLQNTKEQLQKKKCLEYKTKSEQAFQNANQYSQNAIKCADNAQNACLEIELYLARLKKANDAIVQCRLELMVFRFVDCILGVVRNFSIEILTSGSNICFFGGFFDRLKTFGVKMDFLTTPNNLELLYNSDFGQTIRQHFDIYSIVMQFSSYTNDGIFDYFLENENHLQDYIKLQSRLLLELVPIVMKEYTGMWSKYIYWKDNSFFDILKNYTINSLNRFLKQFSIACDTLPFETVFFGIYDEDSLVIRTEKEKWIKKYSIPSCIINDDIVKMRMMTVCWMKSDIGNKYCLLNVFGSDNNEVKKTTKKPLTPEQLKLEICANAVTEFRLDIELLHHLFNILIVITPTRTPMLNQMQFLIDLTQFRFLQLASDQMLLAGLLYPSEKDKIHIQNIILNYYTYDDKDINSTDLISLLQQTIKLILLNEKSSIQNSICGYLFPLVKRLDDVLASTYLCDVALKKFYFEIWEAKEFFISTIDRQKWVKKYKIPPGLQLLHPVTSMAMIAEWMQDGKKEQLLHFFAKKIKSII